MTLDVQLLTIISMVAGGIYLGIALETFRRFSVLWKGNVIWTYVLEISFWMIQTVLLFYMLYKVNYGEIRVYTLLAILLGFSIYVVLFQTLYKKVLEFLIRCFRFITRMVIKITQTFIFKPVKWIISLVVALLLMVLNIILTVLKFVLYPVRFLLKSIYSRLPKR